MDRLSRTVWVGVWEAIEAGKDLWILLYSCTEWIYPPGVQYIYIQVWKAYEVQTKGQRNEFTHGSKQSYTFILIFKK